jgi:hypothetical protein
MSTTGDLVDELVQLRAEKRELERLADEVGTRAKELELVLLERFDAEGVDSSRTGKATASLKISVVPTIEDWDAFADYVVKTRSTHLIERRASVSGCRELFEKGVPIPGVASFTKRSINIRTRSSNNE